MRQMQFFAFFPAMARRFVMAGLAMLVAGASPVKAQDLMPASTALTDTAKQVIVKSGNFMVRDHLVIDLRNGVEWMRCSVGQVWNGSNCAGEALQLTQEDTAKAIIIANEQLGLGWRLPSRAELETLVCNECAPVKIELDSFPDTLAEPYWTGEINGFAPRHIWTVNFMTGHTYGRFFPTQEVLVRLVRDR
jgi:hypothetical protein